MSCNQPDVQNVQFSQHRNWQDMQILWHLYITK